MALMIKFVTRRKIPASDNAKLNILFIVLFHLSAEVPGYRSKVNADSYWNEFYRREFINFPSQFAVFALGEFQSNDGSVVDLGFGNGRDFAFFLQNGYQVWGADSSQQAVKNLRQHYQSLQPNIQKVDFGDVERLRTFLRSIPKNSPRFFYCRFVLHSLSDDCWPGFLKTVASEMEELDKFLLEFRTNIDDALPKSTPIHFRRGLPPARVIGEGARVGLVATYFVQGFGYAKFGVDDAHVARIIFERKNGH